MWDVLVMMGSRCLDGNSFSTLWEAGEYAKYMSKIWHLEINTESIYE